MLAVRLLEDCPILEQVFDLFEERLLLVIVVRLDQLVPSQGVPHEIGLVVFLNVRGLEPNGVVASQNGVVQQGHVRGAGREQVSLPCGHVVSNNRLRAIHGGLRPLWRGAASKRTFFVAYCGVVTSLMGASAHGLALVAGDVGIINGDRDSNTPTMVVKMTMGRYLPTMIFVVDFVWRKQDAVRGKGPASRLLRSGA